MNKCGIFISHILVNLYCVEPIVRSSGKLAVESKNLLWMYGDQ